MAIDEKNAGNVVDRYDVGGMTPDERISVRDNSSASRYELLIDGEVEGVIHYRASAGTVTLIHTEVDAQQEGRGLGSRLVREALEDIRARGLLLEPICPFVRSYLERHPEYRDLVA